MPQRRVPRLCLGSRGLQREIKRRHEVDPKNTAQSRSTSAGSWVTSTMPSGHREAKKFHLPKSPKDNQSVPDCARSEDKSSGRVRAQALRRGRLENKTLNTHARRWRELSRAGDNRQVGVDFIAEDASKRRLAAMSGIYNVTPEGYLEYSAAFFQQCMREYLGDPASR